MSTASNETKLRRRIEELLQLVAELEEATCDNERNAGNQHGTEEVLRREQERSRLILRTTLDGYLLADTSGQLVDVNPAYCRLVGYSRSELLSMNIRQLESSLTDEEIEARIQAMVDFGGARFETQHRHHDGHEVELDVNIAIMQVEETPMVAAFVRDITDRKRARVEREKLQQQLSQSHKMESVGRLAGGVAHDFNNMLSVILGHAELALENVDPSQALFTSLQEIRKAAERSADLTAQLLAFARKQIIVPRALDLNETVEGMLKMLRRLIGEDIDLTWLPGDRLWPVKVDPSQIHQILANLCVNARDAIADVGKVTVETSTAVFDEAYCAAHAGFVLGEFVLLAVSDDGCGMNKETMHNIFEPYFTTKETSGGTGLGLAMIYGIVKQNNGFIKIDSGPDLGATFKIYLPRHVGETAQMHRKDSAEPAARGHETILLVEDELAILRMVTVMLERRGYTVLGASRPGEAIRLAQAHRGEIHLLMTDVVMPEMNGPDLVEQLLSSYPNLKWLYMSGYTANMIARRGVLDDNIHFIHKPFSMNDLAVKVRESLSNS